METKNIHTGGYTLMEMLLVIAIIGIALGIPYMSMVNGRQDAVLESGQASVIQALKNARSRAVSGVGGENHGVHIASNEITVFEGDTYISGAGTQYPLPPGVTLSTGGGANTLIFERLIGSTSNETITITLGGETKTVSISEYGFIE